MSDSDVLERGGRLGKLTRSSHARQLFASMGFGLIAYGLALLTGPFLARALGPEGKGQQAMGDASKAAFAHGEVTYKRAKDGITLDTKRLTAECPDVAAMYAVTRPGTRRFVLSRTSDNDCA